MHRTIFGVFPSNSGSVESEFQCIEYFADLGMMAADAMLYQPELRSQGVNGNCGWRWGDGYAAVMGIQFTGSSGGCGREIWEIRGGYGTCGTWFECLPFTPELLCDKDIPGDKLPEYAWQEHAVYVNHFIDEAFNLVERAQEAIYAEYGLVDPAKYEPRRQLFGVQIIDCESPVNDISESYLQALVTRQGGWICESSYDNLVKRPLHISLLWI